MPLFDEIFELATQPEFAVAKDLVSFAYSAVQAERQRQLLKKLSSDVTELKKLVKRLTEVVGEAIAVDTINSYNAKTELASLHFVEADFAKSHEYAEQAAIGLKQDSVRLVGVHSFLVAAAADIKALQKLASDNAATYKPVLINRASDYREHALDMVGIVRDSVLKRIAIEPYNVHPLKYLRYKIDGVVKSERLTSAVSQSYFQAKREHEADALSAPVVHTLRMAAETWRVVVQGGEPDSATLFL